MTGLDKQSVVDHHIITIGASAGGVEALMRLISGFPPDLAAALFVVLHIAPSAPSMLPMILNRCSALKARHPPDRDTIRCGIVYVAPPDRHLLVRRGYVRLTTGPRENGSRPAVDPLFRSAALAYGPRVIGVVLSGNLGDGSAGLAAIKARGGIAVVQDPAEAIYPGMPRSAVEQVNPDHVAPLAELPDLLVRLMRERVPAMMEGLMSQDQDEEMELEADVAELEPAATLSPRRPGEPSGFGCPDCGGALFSLVDGSTMHFRCRVGHAWSADGLLAEQRETLETALWTALRVLEERVALSTQLADRMRRRGHSGATARFEAQASESLRRAEAIRSALSTPMSAPQGASDHMDTAEELTIITTPGGREDRAP